ncbi:methyltransferase domain-containing protein [Hydrogenimonas cancrithermarum]|uniref:Biotin synthase n=1 Tax=Hydrogenimonas cancrithermarum TaxID=2993563 RepID=A0ABM8FND9_9BACT|nr:methyltransferase domain-containing protein [Hydrogenimonas cancrithermarum]BDY13101.1 biotin synthase [Hydrogenimonas cancrithermarum]
MAAHREFRRFARSYGRYNLIQTRVAEALAKKVPKPFSRIVDLGCGTGGFFRAYEHPFISYLAIDIVPEMTAIHPSGSGVETMVGDFNDPALFERLKSRDFDLLVSSSALQWSRDLDWTLAQIKDLGRPVALAIFTSGTFAALHETAGIASPIRSKDETIALLHKHFDVRIDILKYRLYFKDTLSILRYIKRSGVSGGTRRLGYRQTRQILQEYPLAYLQFEVVVAVGK